MKIIFHRPYVTHFFSQKVKMTTTAEAKSKERRKKQVYLTAQTKASIHVRMFNVRAPNSRVLLLAIFAD